VFVANEISSVKRSVLEEFPSRVNEFVALGFRHFHPFLMHGVVAVKTVHSPAVVPTPAPNGAEQDSRKDEQSGSLPEIDVFQPENFGYQQIPEQHDHSAEAYQDNHSEQ
jgi:hypothetical protein